MILGRPVNRSDSEDDDDRWYSWIATNLAEF